ncbi:carboxylesterase family protein [Aspergillus karnatakaensis]|uniref:carboxylesterase family protein n=1 Tax=Aspergillus karnatakaensis TaxID=1810916 RepID=UPI003CCE11F9
MSTFLAAASAFSLAPSADDGVSFDQRRGLPLLKLPYGTWRAHQYDQETEVYVFRNIRYAAPPVGDLRWAKPVPPEYIKGIQNGSYGLNCIPAPIPDGFFMPGKERLSRTSNEDCLFLDVYVSREVLKRPERPVPVVVWIHGGGYVSGSKDQALEEGYYNGASLIERAHNQLIVVSINYRLGGFGFLAGEPLQEQGTFNAGLHDQRAALTWVQSYIHLLGGDPNHISAWGQSAGAGSIVYHLIAEGGELDPLFRRAVLQSPNFGSNVRSEVYNKRFEDFAEAAGCPTDGVNALSCLRAANSSILREANTRVFLGESSPVPDGKYIRHTALVEYAAGHNWKDIDSVIASHVIDEGSLFLTDPITNGQLESFITGNLPPNSPLQVERVTDLFKSLYPKSSEKEKLAAVYTNILCTCPLRAVLKAYPDSAWAFQYSYLDGIINGKHAADMPATWYNPQLQDGVAIEPLFEQFQRYLTNHARTGNPNIPWSKDYQLEDWPRVKGLDDKMPQDVLNMSNNGFEGIRDEQMSKVVCDTWTQALVDALERNS